MSKIELYKGDCLEIMPKLVEKGVKVDMVLTDPPYGTTVCKWDSVIPLDKMWAAINDLIGTRNPVVLFGQEPFTSYLRISNIKKYKYDWIWEKERLTNIAQVKKRAGKTVETISVFYEKQCGYYPQMIKHEGPKRSNKVKNGKLGRLTDTGNKKAKEYKDTGWRYPTQILKFQRDILVSNLHPTQN